MTTPENVAGTAQLIGYARVSTQHQNLDRQLDALRAEGIPDDRIFTDKSTGSNMARPGWDRLMAHVRAGDVVVVLTLDRVGRSLTNTLAVVDDLGKRGVALKTLKEGISTEDNTVMGRAMLKLLALIGDLEREFNAERVAHAREVAAKAGKRAGRPPALTADQVSYATHLRDVDNLSISEIAARVGVSRATVHRALPPRPEPAAPTASGTLPDDRA